MEYYAPRSVAECLEILGSESKMAPLAGGTDLIPRLKQGGKQVTGLVSLRHLQELRGIERNGVIRIGAATTLAAVLEELKATDTGSALQDAAGYIGSRQIRNAATVGGNLCNAAPSADTAPSLLALGAVVTLQCSSASRTLPLGSFFVAPGTTVLENGEVLTQVDVPIAKSGSGSCYVRQTPRKRMDLAVTGVAAALEIADEVIIRARIALGAVAPTPMLAEEAAARLVGCKPERSVLEQVSTLAAEACAPIDDLRATADYRKHLVSVLTSRAVRFAYARARESFGGTS